MESIDIQYQKKLIADTPLYNIEKKRIVYMLSQTSDILFAGMRV